MIRFVRLHNKPDHHCSIFHTGGYNNNIHVNQLQGEISLFSEVIISGYDMICLLVYWQIWAKCVCFDYC